MGDCGLMPGFWIQFTYWVKGTNYCYMDTDLAFGYRKWILVIWVQNQDRLGIEPRTLALATSIQDVLLWPVFDTPELSTGTRFNHIQIRRMSNTPLISIIQSFPIFTSLQKNWRYPYYLYHSTESQILYEDSELRPTVNLELFGTALLKDLS